MGVSEGIGGVLGKAVRGGSRGRKAVSVHPTDRVLKVRASIIYLYFYLFLVVFKSVFELLFEFMFIFKFLLVVKCMHTYIYSCLFIYLSLSLSHLQAWKELAVFLQEFVENNFGRPGTNFHRLLAVKILLFFIIFLNVIYII